MVAEKVKNAGGIGREFTTMVAMADIDRLSRRVPNICKVAPSEAEVHPAGAESGP
jgi:dihydroxyacid dehydratase/phosphogluconate dehydratase